MTHTMPALVLNGPGDVQLAEKPVPTPGPGEVVLAVEATTICGTDLRIISGEKTTGVRPGVTLGHEIAGRIASLGDGVEGLTVGRQATVSIVVSCGICRACLAGQEHLCSHCELIGYGLDGGLAPWLCVPARAVSRGNIIPATTEMPATRLALAEPLSCVLNGHRRHGGVNPGETVVIIGGGAIGLLHTQLNVACGAGKVILCEKHADRRERAAAMGAITTGPDHLSEVVAEHTDGYGADLVIVAIGRHELAEESLDLAAPGGRVSWFAGFPKGSTATITPNTVHYQELTVSGGSNARRADVHRAVDMLGRADIDETSIVTHVFGLSHWKEAVEAVRGHAGVKIAIDPRR
ncbi:alcohol dehydrogenase catalytic domain-containing protein [Cutibacterium sp. WCA-380-WT-3A]|uniref:Alcohol dehydrogenase catalytic domain-containing protein n=1 Tax=Cutibacterium porci TaxID=2605781 RepID=A0A7K0J9M1_9ACTN|nr:alcohol dehydrogenase catalytic domain-containing protein [Cutibacterium porci]MSS46677.1 alcohol dehydrogenase catalytic domain-containing protein [Cutibacterium porci]